MKRKRLTALLTKKQRQHLREESADLLARLDAAALVASCHRAEIAELRQRFEDVDEEADRLRPALGYAETRIADLELDRRRLLGEVDEPPPGWVVLGSLWSRDGSDIGHYEYALTVAGRAAAWAHYLRGNR